MTIGEKVRAVEEALKAGGITATIEEARDGGGYGEPWCKITIRVVAIAQEQTERQATVKL